MCFPMGVDIEHIAKPFFEGKTKTVYRQIYRKILADYIQARLKSVMLHSATHGIRQCIQLHFS